jgi:hypothetical protein
MRGASARCSSKREALAPNLSIAIGIPLTRYPPGGRRHSPSSGSHRTQRADFPHWARQKLIHSLAIACNFE